MVIGFDRFYANKQLLEIYKSNMSDTERTDWGRRGRTFQTGLGTAKLPKSDDLLRDITISVDQDCRRVPFGVAFDAHVRSYLAEFDLAKLASQLPP